ncbi:MAG: hypothetical protein ACTH0E_09045 [Candidatus Microbacterium stercoravium]
MTLRRRILASLAALSMIGIIFAVPAVQPTDAAWQDSEAGITTFTAAAALEPPVAAANGCVAGGLLGIVPTVTISWSVPEGANFTVDDIEFGQLNSGGLLMPIVDLELLNSISTTGGPGAYTTRIGSLMLQNLLGGQKIIGMRFRGPGEWASEWRVVTAKWGALGIGNSCVISLGL